MATVEPSEKQLRSDKYRKRTSSSLYEIFGIGGLGVTTGVSKDGRRAFVRHKSIKPKQCPAPGSNPNTNHTPENPNIDEQTCDTLTQVELTPDKAEDTPNTADAAPTAEWTTADDDILIDLKKQNKSWAEIEERFKEKNKDKAALKAHYRELLKEGKAEIATPKRNMEEKKKSKKSVVYGEGDESEAEGSKKKKKGRAKHAEQAKNSKKRVVPQESEDEDNKKKLKGNGKSAKHAEKSKKRVSFQGEGDESEDEGNGNKNKAKAISSKQAKKLRSKKSVVVQEESDDSEEGESSGDESDTENDTGADTDSNTEGETESDVESDEEDDDDSLYESEEEEIMKINGKDVIFYDEGDPVTPAQLVQIFNHFEQFDGKKWNTLAARIYDKEGIRVSAEFLKEKLGHIAL